MVPMQEVLLRCQSTSCFRFEGTGLEWVRKATEMVRKAPVMKRATMKREPQDGWMRFMRESRFTFAGEFYLNMLIGTLGELSGHFVEHNVTLCFPIRRTGLNLPRFTTSGQVIGGL